MLLFKMPFQAVNKIYKERANIQSVLTNCITFFFRPETINYGDTYQLNYRPSDAGPSYGGPSEQDVKELLYPYKYPYKYQHGRVPNYFTVPCETCEPYEDNRKKLPRLLLPWPITLFTKDRQRPFPDNTFFIF